MRVGIPQLQGVVDAPSIGAVWFHRNGADRLRVVAILAGTATLGAYKAAYCWSAHAGIQEPSLPLISEGRTILL